jgi:hypothetical protein
MLIWTMDVRNSGQALTVLRPSMVKARLPPPDANALLIAGTRPPDKGLKDREQHIEESEMIERPDVTDRFAQGAEHSGVRIIREIEQDKRAGVGGWLALAVLLLLSVAGLIGFSQMGYSEDGRSIAAAGAMAEQQRVADDRGQRISE